MIIRYPPYLFFWVYDLFFRFYGTSMSRLSRLTHATMYRICCSSNSRVCCSHSNPCCCWRLAIIESLFPIARWISVCVSWLFWSFNLFANSSWFCATCIWFLNSISCWEANISNFESGRSLSRSWSRDDLWPPFGGVLLISRRFALASSTCRASNCWFPLKFCVVGMGGKRVLFCVLWLILLLYW